MNIARKRCSAILLACFALLVSLSAGGCNTPAPKPGTEIEIDIRGRRFPAVVEKKPLHRASTAS